MRINRYIFALAAMIFMLTGCSKEDALENKIDFSSPYVIEDDPTDPIQHHRYQIYKEYGVPVFFNDTISSKYIGTTYTGTDIYRYETLDLNWGFSSHNKKSVTYWFDYITDPEEQETALQFVDEFLKQVSKPMRPFSMLLVPHLEIYTNGSRDVPKFFNGFRTLAIPDVGSIKQADIPAFATTILKSMVKARVMNNSAVSDAFGEISNTNKYYGKSWVDELKCKWGVTHTGTYWKPSTLYDLGIEYQYAGGYNTNVATVAAFKAERDLIFREIGRFGFICGDVSSGRMLEHLMSPKNVKDDMEYYIDQMLSLGSEKFEARYCSSSMVNDKYNILATYIKETLEVNF